MTIEEIRQLKEAQKWSLESFDRFSRDICYESITYQDQLEKERDKYKADAIEMTRESIKQQIKGE